MLFKSYHEAWAKRRPGSERYLEIFKKDLIVLSPFDRFLEASFEALPFNQEFLEEG